MPELRVLIVEDEPLIAEDISDFLGHIDYATAGIAYDSETALDYLVNRNPDLVLLDISIEGSMNGRELAEIIKKKYNIPYLFITSHSDKETLAAASKTIPYGFIVKPFNEKDLMASIEMAVVRHAQENKSLIPKLNDINQVLGINITQKEYICLEQILQGSTNKQMAELQYVSINTIKTHLKNLFQKLDVTNRTSAIKKVLGMNN